MELRGIVILGTVAACADAARVLDHVVAEVPHPSSLSMARATKAANAGE